MYAFQNNVTLSEGTIKERIFPIKYKVSFMLNTHTWCMQNHYSRGCCLLLKLSGINIQEPNVFYILMIIYNKTKLPRIHFKASILKL